MSTTTLVQEKLADSEDALSSTAPTPGRNSVEIVHNDEKLEEQIVADEPEPLSKTTLSLLVMGLTLSIFLVALDFNIITTAIPRITDEFQDLNSVAWYGAAFFLTTSSLQGPWGKMYKFFNLKWTILSALFIFEVGSLICGVAHNNTTLIIGRAIQGIGASGLQNGTYTIVGVVLPPRQRPMFTGILGAMFGITCVIGPLLGGAFTDRLSWRWCFFINLPLGAAVAITLLLSMKPPKHSPRAGMTWQQVAYEMDPLGVAFLVSATLCALLALQWGGVEKPWSDSSVVGCLVGFVLLLIAFVVDQYLMKERASYPFRILRKRNVAIAVAFNFMIGGAFILYMYLLPLYFQSIRGASPTGSGIHLLPFILAMTFSSIFAAGLITAVGMPYYVMAVGTVTATIGSGLTYTLDIDTPAGKWIGYLILLGFGYGAIIQLGIIVGQASSKAEDIPVATAAINLTQTYGGALMVAIAQTIFSNKLIQGLKENVPSVDPNMVIHAGATDLRNNLTPDTLASVLRVFMDALSQAFIVPIAITGVAFFIGLFMDKNMRRKGGIKLAAG